MNNTLFVFLFRIRFLFDRMIFGRILLFGSNNKYFLRTQTTVRHELQDNITAVKDTDSRLVD